MSYIAACYRQFGIFFDMHLGKLQLIKFLSMLILSIPIICRADSLENQSTAEIHIWPHETQGSPTLSSLQQAIDYSYISFSPNITTIKFLIHEGTYNEQAAILHPKHGVHYEFTSASSGEYLPSFDGHQQQLTWLRIISTNGFGSSVTINGLKIKNYVTAISIEGDREDQSKFNAENKISNMQFENIGQTSLNSPPSTAVIRLVNSQKNEIIDNSFTNIKNIKDCNLLHSIYLAHHSSDNSIKHNSFTSFCGSAIRVRDNSNRNTAQLNSFTDIQNEQLMDQWFCDKNLRQDCTKKQQEQYSHSNIFDMNEFSP
ncbi:hypothetical protein ACCD00_02000 [Pseudomonas sp. Pseusp3]|uniref:hypothetical protein n=1 Tax=Pseudomonas sp. Pseusp3 TaxID=3243029 RepID=UPI0039B032C8